MTKTLTKKPKVAPALEEAVKVAAKALSLTLPDLLSSNGKAYEAWFLFSLVERVRQMRVDIKPYDHKDKPAQVFRIKGGPGNIVSASAKGKQPCHFRIESTKTFPLELHLSINHVGGSGETHEMDVSLMPKFVVDGIRKGSKGTPYNGPRHLCIELKNHAQTSVLDKNVARALLGAATDLREDRMVVGAGLYIDPYHFHQMFGLVTAANIGDSSQKLLANYEIASFPDVYPSSGNGMNAFNSISAYVQKIAS
ncbi:hypothetical protein PQU94_07930 [Asticcacaulis sp. DXS10W]|uniref:Uncharacterized protein n=1 Tax=Asticcacaulis currens TaxID=2984210 RepID=A0ABT5IED4_9CAUL|nr:hypothetical protein [Asticcacaulis currens]MDC7694210.1 hypothetical protein [Asticcacaulis currens]